MADLTPPVDSATVPAPSGTAPAGGRRAVFDPFSGISGDMILGAWVDLGLPAERIAELAPRLGLGGIEVRAERCRRAGISAVHVRFLRDGEPLEAPAGEPGSAPHHVADPGRGHGRPYREIRELLERAELEDRVRRIALGAFGRLAAAEALIHGVRLQEVHFHEVGAADAVLDVCGAAAGFVGLGIEEASTRPVGIGHGEVVTAHGRYPIPAPATLRLLEGTGVRETGYPYECVTPTGAALLAELAGGRTSAGDLTVRRVGYGAGTRDPEDHPNCLRIWLGDSSPGAAEALVVLQADLDDMTPEYVPALLERCLEAGARDASVQSLLMKKGRPGWRLEAVVEPHRREAVEEAVLRHSSSLGVRGWRAERRVLPRRTERRLWRGHAIRVKLTERPGRREGPFGKPEFEDVAAAAAAEGMEPAGVLRALRECWPDLAD